jgi:hypothetical protein
VVRTVTVWERLADPASRRALVVAHPDDETLWAGGLVLRHPGDWTVICCSIPRRDPIRAWKFFGAVRALGGRGEIIPFVEPGPTEPLGHLDLLDLDGFDLIVTHGPAGEYGHAHHKQVCAHVTAGWADRTLTIGMRAGGEGAHLVSLDMAEWQAKVAALHCYDHCLPYEGADMPKWEALLRRYGLAGPFDLRRESYDAA